MLMIFPLSEDFNGGSSDSGGDGGQCPFEFDIPLSDEVGIADEDRFRLEDQVLCQSSATIWDGGHPLIEFHNNVDYSDGKDDIPNSDEDIPVGEDNLCKHIGKNIKEHQIHDQDQEHDQTF